MITERLEEVLEAIWSSTENKTYSLETIQARCAVDFTEKDLKELEDLNLIVRSADKILFSSNGREIAAGIMRRHRLAEVLVSSILKMKNSQMEEVACKVEHCLLPEVEESICTLLGHPDICPDGKPIPKGKCCKNGTRIHDNVVVGLNELKASEKGKISYIKPSNHSNLHHLLSLGIYPGTIVTVHRTSPVCCVKLENTELALDKVIAENIFVWRIPSN